VAKKVKAGEGDGNDIGLSAIIKKYGNVISSGDQIFDKKKNLNSLNVSPAWDLALNGGLLEGSWTVISGQAKSGKSSWCLQVAANAQAEGRNVIYIDAESRLKNYNLIGTKGLDLTKIQIVHSEDGEKDLSAEDFLEIASQLMKLPQNAGAVCIIDSCSSLVPRAEMDADASATLRASLPKLLSHWVKKNAQIVTKNKILLIIITHYITNTSGYGKTKIPDCGVMVQYQADTRIDIAKTEDWEEDGKKIGIKINGEINCSSMGASGRSLVSYLRFGHGIDSVKETLELGETYGLIDKAGAWYKLDFLDEYPLHHDKKELKFQGQVRLYEFIEQNKEIYDILQIELKKVLE
jgi:recombination protein RecA